MKTIKNIGNFIYGILAINSVWLFASKLVNKKILPSPLTIYTNLGKLFKDNLLIHMGYSLYRIFVGTCIAVIIGLIIGLVMARSKSLNKILNPILYLTYPIPKIALLPAVMLLFGLKEKSKIIMIVLIVVFQVIISVRDSIKAIPVETYNILYCLGASKFHTFKDITLPAALSSILSSIRIALGTAISILFFTEVYGTNYGMGYYIMDAWMRINYIDMYSGILVLSFIGFILFLIIDLLENLLIKW